MASISVCMIVKNEEKVLERCLLYLQGIWDELIIVDTGSSDRTKEIAARFTDQVYDFTWIDPIHETVRTEPVVFDSDIEILHRPHDNHASRDFRIF